MTERMDAAVARIYRDKTVVGAGLLVTPRYMVTCAHVVAAALNLRGDLTQAPIDPARLSAGGTGHGANHGAGGGLATTTAGWRRRHRWTRAARAIACGRRIGRVAHGELFVEASVSRIRLFGQTRRGRLDGRTYSGSAKLWLGASRMW